MRVYVCVYACVCVCTCIKTKGNERKKDILEMTVKIHLSLVRKAKLVS